MKHYISITIRAEVITSDDKDKYDNTVICNYITLGNDGNISISPSTDKANITGITTSVNKVMDHLPVGLGKITPLEETTKEDSPL